MRAIRQPSTNPSPDAPRTARRIPRLLVAVVAIAVCALLSGGVAYAHANGGTESGPARAADDGHRRGHGARGTVASIDGSTFVLTKRDGTGVTVTTSDTTAFSLTVQGTIADAVVGSYVVAHGPADDAGTLTARWLAIKPAPADAGAGGKWQWRHGVAGVVSAYDPATGLLTITGSDGTPVSVLTTADTKVLKTTAATIADLSVGATVGVHGTYADDGTLAADRVKILPAAIAKPVPVEPVVQTVETTTTVAAAPATTAAPTTTTATTVAPEPTGTEVRGVVTAVEGTTLTLATRDGATVVVTTDASTVFEVKDCDGRDSGDGTAAPGVLDSVAVLADVVVGATVKVVGTSTGDGTVAATAVILGGDGDGGHRGAWDGDGEHRGGDWSGRDGSGHDKSGRGWSGGDEGEQSGQSEQGESSGDSSGS
jgi:hypothetical protein